MPVFGVCGVVQVERGHAAGPERGAAVVVEALRRQRGRDAAGVVAVDEQQVDRAALRLHPLGGVGVHHAEADVVIGDPELAPEGDDRRVDLDGLERRARQVAVQELGLRAAPRPTIAMRCGAGTRANAPSIVRV